MFYNYGKRKRSRRNYEGTSCKSYIWILSVNISRYFICCQPAVYLGADNQGAAVLPLIVCSILAEVAGIAINRFTGKAGVLMLIPTVNALLFSAAIILSIIPQVDSLGYLVSGLYSFEDMKAFILYAVFAILTWLGYLAASFMDMQK